MTDFTTPPEDILARLIDACISAGASAADARLSVSEGVSVAVREGRLESIERDESAGVALRCLFGQRQAHVSGTDLSPEALATLSERCAAMAKAAPEDEFAGLADAGELVTKLPDVDLSGDTDMSPDTLEADALEAEAAALSVSGVKMVSNCGYGWTRTERWVAASNGFQAYRTGCSSGIGIAAIAQGEDGSMERDYESWSTRRIADRPSPAEIGRTAGERTVARLNPRKVDTQIASVIYDRRVSTSLLSALLGAISGPAVARGISFLKDRMGEEVFARGTDIIDDPFRPHGMGARNHDGEGRAVSVTHIIRDGRLTCWLLNGPSARQLGLAANGFASMGFGDPPGVTSSNLHLAAGDISPEEMMRNTGKGLLVTDMFGPSINPNTGDYSVGVSGFWFEDGAIAYPVSEVTIAGDLPSMFARLVPASDLEFRGSTNAPSLLIEEMSLAGS